MKKVTNTSCEQTTGEPKGGILGSSPMTSFYSDVYRIRREYQKKLESTLRVFSRQYGGDKDRKSYDVSLGWDTDPLSFFTCKARDAFPSLSPDQLITNVPLWYRPNRPVYKKPEIGKIRREIVDDILDRAFSLYIGVVECLYINLRFCPMHSCDSTLEFYLVLALQGRIEDFFKYFSVEIFCRHTHQVELPPRPECLTDLPLNMYLCLGATGRYIKKIVKNHNSRNSITTLFSLTTVKNCGSPLSASKQTRFFLKHIKNMTGSAYDCPKLDEYLEACGITTFTLEKAYNKFSGISDRIKKHISNIICHLYYQRSKPLTWKSPSQGATVQSGRSECGMMGYVKNNYTCERELYGMANFGPNCPIIPIYRDYNPDDTFVELKERLRRVFHPEPWILGRPPVFNSRPSARVHAVLEPFKVRPITAGSADLYQFARILQTNIWGTLKKNPVFRLTGERVSPLVFQGLLGTYVPSCDLWVAGDYDAASDGINPEFSAFVQEQIGLNLGLSNEEFYWYLLSQLGHDLDYSCVLDNETLSSLPEFQREIPFSALDFDEQCIRIKHWSEEGGLPDEHPNLHTHLVPSRFLQQKWGQLMGSPSSFPVLCLINCCAFSAAVEEYELLNPYTTDERIIRTFDNGLIGRNTDRLDYLHKMYGLLINGDDIIFHGPQQLIDLWTLYERKVGLKPSVGKNFKCAVDKKIAWSMINNTMFRFNLEDSRLNSVELLPMVKMGLAEGKSKVQSDSRDDRDDIDDDLMATIDKLEECHYGMVGNENRIERIKEVFLHHNFPKLSKSKRSWTLPRSLGGLGLSFLDSSPNPTQLRVANLLYEHPEKTAPCTKMAPVFPTKPILPRHNFTLTREDKVDTWAKFGSGFWLADTVEKQDEGFTKLMNYVSPTHGRYPPELASEFIADYRRRRTLYVNV